MATANNSRNFSVLILKDHVAIKPPHFKNRSWPISRVSLLEQFKMCLLRLPVSYELSHIYRTPQFTRLHRFLPSSASGRSLIWDHTCEVVSGSRLPLGVGSPTGSPTIYIASAWWLSSLSSTHHHLNTVLLVQYLYLTQRDRRWVKH